jgi:bifunctional DNase/RNase
MLHKARIAGLTIDPSSNTPIIILKTEDDDRAIPIWIGLLEAASIASALQNVDYERPMTHDLFKNFSDYLQTEVTKIEVCDLRDNTFFALIHFANQSNEFTMDARPSDAIAIALRFRAPIYIDDKVIAKSNSVEGDVEVLDQSEEGRKWAEYLENLNPEDFGKYKV